jgi:hypothetical protein
MTPLQRLLQEAIPTRPAPAPGAARPHLRAIPAA